MEIPLRLLSMRPHKRRFTMSDHIAVAKHNHFCDFCGGLIPKGTKCRIIHDDFMPNLVYFEHLHCPPSKPVFVSSSTPKKPIKPKFTPAFCVC
jgi:hypothetical protein